MLKTLCRMIIHKVTEKNIHDKLNLRSIFTANLKIFGNFYYIIVKNNIICTLIYQFSRIPKNNPQRAMKRGS